MFEPIGLTVVVPLIKAFSAASGGQPWTAGTTRTEALSNFTAYVRANRAELESELPEGSQLDAVHLLTAEDIGGGKAYVNAMCLAEPATGVTQYYANWSADKALSYAFRVFAHEFGHNFGFHHDNQVSCMLSN